MYIIHTCIHVFRWRAREASPRGGVEIGGSTAPTMPRFGPERPRQRTRRARDVPNRTHETKTRQNASGREIATSLVFGRSVIWNQLFVIEQGYLIGH